MDGKKGDYRGYCVKAIPTKEKSYRITLANLKALYKEAKDCGKKPLLITKIGKYQLEIYVNRRK